MTNQAPTTRLAVALVLLGALSGRALADHAAAAEPKQFRVCGDPNNMPFSDE